jgi:hypothetical protein
MLVWGFTAEVLVRVLTLGGLAGGPLTGDLDGDGVTLDVDEALAWAARP